MENISEIRRSLGKSCRSAQYQKLNALFLSLRIVRTHSYLHVQTCQ